MIDCEKNLISDSSHRQLTDSKNIWLILHPDKPETKSYTSECSFFTGQIWSYKATDSDIVQCRHTAAEKVPRGGRSGCGCKFLATPKLNLTLYDCIKSKDQLGWSKLIWGQTKLKSWDIFPLKCNWWHFVEFALVKSSGVLGRHLRHPIVWGESSYKRSTPLDDNLIIPQPPSCI